MKWAYDHRVGRAVFSFLLFRRRIFSHLMGLYCDSARSRRQIRSFIDKLKIDTEEVLQPLDSFVSFNDFFTRRLKPSSRPYDDAPRAVISPADGRVLVYPRIEQDTVVPVKGRSFTLSALLEMAAGDFLNGSLAVIRLCPADHHRFHFPCDGEILTSRLINGFYHSVNPIALASRISVFTENKRALTLMRNPLLGKVAMVEIGAFGVGSIVQTFTGSHAVKFQEKGYFKYGGSTIVLVFRPHTLTFSADLIENTAEGYETFLKVGERIGTGRSGT